MGAPGGWVESARWRVSPRRLVLTSEALRKAVRHADADQAQHDAPTQEREEIKQLGTELFELRSADEISKPRMIACWSASAVRSVHETTVPATHEPNHHVGGHRPSVTLQMVPLGGSPPGSSIDDPGWDANHCGARRHILAHNHRPRAHRSVIADISPDHDGPRPDPHTVTEDGR